MIIEIAKWILIVFGFFFICIGGLMFFKPKIARAILRKAGSTNLINYGEITNRMIPAFAFVLFSEQSNYSKLFKIIGWFMLATSLGLYFIPKKWHHDFSNKAADILKPIYFQLISPISIVIGVTIIILVF